MRFGGKTSRVGFASTNRRRGEIFCRDASPRVLCLCGVCVLPVRVVGIARREPGERRDDSLRGKMTRDERK